MSNTMNPLTQGSHSQMNRNDTKSYSLKNSIHQDGSQLSQNVQKNMLSGIIISHPSQLESKKLDGEKALYNEKRGYLSQQKNIGSFNQ
jgi:hypothetical protein